MSRAPGTPLSSKQTISHPIEVLNNGVAGSGKVSEDYLEQDINKKLQDIKRQFHQNRQLVVKHLPRTITIDEVSKLLTDLPVQYIRISCNDETSSTAHITLKQPDVLEDWDPERIFFVRGQSVSVCPTETDNVLCVARLPFHFTEEKFYELVKPFGEVKMSFLMISEKSGQSKGYGFVRYIKKDSALAARNALNERIVHSYRLACDWLDPSHLSIKSLHSKCLYVDHLPSNFRDMGEFRKIFSRIVNPPYCQIALKNGCPQDWGLVEYLSAQEAEMAQSSVNGYRLKNHVIRVCYYIPGVRAINLYLQLLNDTQPQGKSAGLLPDPTGQSILMSIQAISRQNPAFANSLRNIIMQQIQEAAKNNAEENSSSGRGVKANDVGTYKKNNMVQFDMFIPPQFFLNNVPPFMNQAPTVLPPGNVIPILPNPPMPPPSLLEKINHSPSEIPAPISVSVALKEAQCVTPQAYWNNMGLQGKPPVLTPPMTNDSSLSLPFPPGLVASNILQEITHLPLEIQQNLLNMIHSSPVFPHNLPAMQPFSPQMLQAFPGVTPVANPQQGPFFPFPNYNPLNDPPIQFPPSIHSLIAPHVLNPALSLTPKPLFTAPIPPVTTFVPRSSFTYDRPTILSPDLTPTGFVAPRGLVTPTTPVMIPGRKRKFLPSPEMSPEGNYVGQHSQGIGGHYADSYFKKTRRY